ncbi:LysR family transcriptional regulator [Kordiimonas marina]|uniref:LysR family transcriptional regulator n=1 Tax=Kordiimonas marina TaxID=2872312 RepID=UPI001FF2CCB3|nr:LysR family transcriptional regulator [Kordiimonas marina]MCJ9430585.1 LysR family transcriptional regulator [Kordiimonas marina]
MDVLDDMAVFIRVVEKGSFSAAGRELRMSPALVSSRIARLERHLGVRLFNRTTRKVGVTDAGRRYYEDCLDIRRRVAEAEARLMEDDGAPKGVLRLTCGTGFANTFMTRTLPAFSEKYPDIQLQYQMTDRLIDLLEDGMDVGLRTGPLVDTSLKARVLAPSPRYIFAAPDYLARHGVPQTPHDLVNHKCLLLRFPGSRQFRWRFEGPDGGYELALSGTLDSTSGAVLKDWALMGAGLIMKDYFEVADEVARGKLKIVLAGHMPTDSYLSALYPYDRYTPPRVRAFIDFLAAEVKADPRFGDTAPPANAFA